MKMNKRLLAWVGAAMLMIQAPLVLADQLQDIQQRGVLRVAIPQDFPPFGSIGTDMQPQGYDIDMAHYLADKMKLKLQLVPVTGLVAGVKPIPCPTTVSDLFCHQVTDRSK